MHAVPEARLFWTEGSVPRDAVIAGPTTLGSAEFAPIRVRGDRAISRLHLAIKPAPDGVWIEDLGSTNGTWYHQALISRLRLHDGARFVAGNTEFTLRHAPAAAESPLHPFERLGDLYGRSPAMREVFAQLMAIAPSPETVLIHGETGTGKELVAKALHAQSPRARGPFVTVDCGSLPENLLDAQLFGHTKGAFTGATESREGAFEAANGGTIFLDEIAELPLELQPRLLRALESRSVRRLGTTAYAPIDVRFVCATHKDLRAMVNAGNFREDLYFRVAVLQLELPPLRERPEDVLLLLQQFLDQRLAGVPIDPAVERAILARPWAGNVRELRNFAGRVNTLGWTAALGMDRDSRPLRAAASPSVTPPLPGARSVPPPLPASLPPPALADAADEGGALPPPPARFLRGNYTATREALDRWWERWWLAALRERHGADSRALMDEAGITKSWLWKMSKRQG